MEQKLEIQNNSKSKKLSIFYKETPPEYDSQIFEKNDEQNEKGKFNYKFQIRNSQPQRSHEGDQDISYNSYKAEIDDFIQKSQKNTNLTNESICKMLQAQKEEEEEIKISQKDYLTHYPQNIQSQLKSNFTEAIKNNTNVNDNSLSSNFQDTKVILEQNSSSKTKIINENSLNRDDEVQSNYFLSKNTIIKSETKNQNSQNASQCKSINQSNQKIKNSHILIQDDIFYEKDLKKLGTKVNFALQNQYQFQQDFKATTIYKQNLQKAAKIVSRLLNSSMNRVMRIRQYANNFITLLKLRHQNRKIEGLSHQEFLIINDLSHFHLQKSKIHKSQKVLRFLFGILKFAKFFHTFMPSNSIRVIWDLILVGFTYVFLYVYSLIIFFDQNYFDPVFLQKFNITIFSLFLVDILVNLNTAFYEKDIIITKRMLIAKKYFFSSIFVTDCVSMFILGYKIVYSNKSVIYDLKQSIFAFGLNSLIFFKANGISTKKKRFDYVFTLTENQKHICKLINQIASVITVAHIAAIGWYFVGVQEANYNQTNWLEKIGIQSNSIYEQYIYAIYWSITTMTTVGYGDISATNSVEALYISITMILFSCVFAYSINNIGFILQEIEKSSKQLNDDLSTIQRYLIRKNVSIQLKSRVRHYLSFLAQEQKDRDKQQEDKILSELSNKLRNEITLEINSKILNSQNIFSSNFTKSTLNKLIFIMKEILVNPNEIIISEDQQDDSSIYFIQSGIIEIYQQQIQKKGQINIIKTLTDGQIFGDISFFSGLQRQSSARSINLSTLYKISRDEFIEILKENKEDFERFKMMEDQIIFQKEKSVIHNDCYYCKDSNHIANQCPKTHKLFDKQFVVLKHNFSMFQERSQSHKMNLKIKQNARQSFKKIQNAIDCLKQDLEFEDGESFFFIDENELSSNDSMSQYEDEDEDDDSQSDTPNNSLEKNKNQKRSIKGSVKERIDKSSKNILKSQKSYQTNNEETEQQFNQDNQIQRCHSNLVYESQDIPKTILTIVGSQSKIKSSDASDSVDSNNQEESSKNNFSRQRSQQESNVVPSKKGRDSVQCRKSVLQQQTIYQKEKEGSDQNNQKFLEQQRAGKKSINSSNIQLEDQQKKLLKQRSKKSSHKISSQYKEDQLQCYPQENSQGQQSFKSVSNKKTSVIQHSSQSHKNSFSKSLKYLNQSQKEPRYSVDQQIQSIAALMFLHNKNISSQQLNNPNNIQSYQQNSAKSDSSKLSIKDRREQSQISKKSNRVPYNNENSQNNLQTQQSLNRNKKQASNNELIIDRLSRILQNTQIPLLLQLTTGKSFQHLDSQFLGNPMDQFDKMQCFKKFYPDYNFDKVLQKLKSSKQEQKRLKKIKLATKERRQNIGLTKFSIFQANSNVFKLLPQDYDINLYKPTYLSYGTRMKKGNIYPINNFYLQNN